MWAGRTTSLEYLEVTCHRNLGGEINGTWSGTMPTQRGPQGSEVKARARIPSFHAAWDSIIDCGTFQECTHWCSPPTVVKSDNPIITAILNGLFRSEVSRATVCTASPSALTRLCRFMQMRSNPRDAGDSGVFKSVSWPFLRQRSQGGRGVTMNEERERPSE